MGNRCFANRRLPPIQGMMGKDCCGFCIIYTPKSAFDDALNQINMMLDGILKFYNQLKELIFLQRVHFICTKPLPFASNLPQNLQRNSR